MDPIRIITITNQTDIHAARMYTREMARLVGFELPDQAQVSMATSTTAECLQMSGAIQSPHSQIKIQVLNNGRRGLRLYFECPLMGEYAGLQSQLRRVQQLVDEVKSEQMPDGSILVTVTKWIRRRDR